MLKWLKIVIGVCIVAIVILFAQAQRHVYAEYSIVIAAKPEQVWNFLSQGKYARGWSVFFDHFTTLSDAAPEGQVDSLRRCFRNANEQGIYWDERTVQADLYRYRRIATFNVQGVKSSLLRSLQFNAHQIYADTGDGKTQLTFRGDLDDWSHYGPVARFVFWVSTFESERVFKYNLTNIRDMLEQGDNYKRQYPWEKDNFFDRM